MARAADSGEVAVLQELQKLLAEQRLSAFTRLLNKTAEQHPQWPDLWQLAAEYSQMVGNESQLRQCLVRWAAVAPQDPAPRLRLADLLVQSGQVRESLEALDLAKQAGADPMDLAVRKAKILLSTRQWEQARRILDDAPATIEAVGLNLVQSLRWLVENLQAAEGNPEARELVQPVCARAMNLQCDAQGPGLASGAGSKRLRWTTADPAVVQHVQQVARVLQCGSAIGSVSMLDLLAPMVPVSDGAFYGSRMRIYVVERDLDVLTLALASRDLRRFLADEALTWLAGADALERLRRLLRERYAEPPVQINVGSDPQIQPVLEEAAHAIQKMTACWYDDATRYYQSLGPGHWADVLGDSPSRPPRVLLITTEFSSYLKYAVRDLAAAFEKMRWQATVLKEATTTQRTCRPVVARAMAEVRPDLVWQINYGRSSWQGAVPDGVPFVCWDQDGMMHLASKEQGERMGPFDFLACLGSGVHYVRRHGYPSRSLLYLPMCVDRSVFHPDAAAQAELDVCYVCHHGWTVDNRIDKVLEGMSADGRAMLRPAVRIYADRLEKAFASGDPPRPQHLTEILREACSARGLAMPEEQLAKLSDHLHRIVANAVWRHQAVRMMAGCGVDMALYGMGWAENPEFARFARGTVEHGEPLARVFRASRIALQAVLAGNEHQRLWEAAACGTPVLMRYHPGDELYTILRGWMERLDRGRGKPLDEIIPEAMRRSPADRYAYLFIREGLMEGNTAFDEQVLNCVRHAARTPSVRDKLGDAYEDLVFRTSQDLRPKLERILKDESHRARLRERLLQAADAHHSYGVQVPRIIRQIRERLLRSACLLHR